MKTLLVPVDFSDTSLNAARYAAGLAKQVGAKIILIHAYEPPVSYPLRDGIQVSDEGIKEINLQELKKIADDLSSLEPVVKFEIMQLEGSLLDVIKQFEDNVDVFMAVMGITGAGLLKEKLVGSNTLKVAKGTSVPVMIIPKNAKYSDLNDIGLTTDYRDVVNTVPEKKIKEFLNATGARLHILNVDFEGEYVTENTPQESGIMEAMFQDVHPKYHFIQYREIAEGLSEYSVNNSIEIMISIPKKHSFFESFVHPVNMTKKLIFHSKVPVLVMHY